MNQPVPLSLAAMSDCSTCEGQGIYRDKNMNRLELCECVLQATVALTKATVNTVEGRPVSTQYSFGKCVVLGASRTCETHGQAIEECRADGYPDPELWDD